MYLGIDIGGTNIKFALINESGIIKERWFIKTNKNGHKIPHDVIHNIQNQTIGGENLVSLIAGIGIGVPGPISADGETVLKAVNLGWNKVRLKTIIEDKLKLPVILLNDANAAALGEMWSGAAKGNLNLLFVTLGTGVGGGIILDGKILNGVRSSAGEIGHIPVYSEESRTCGCGNTNCLETFSSANGLIKTIKAIDSKKEYFKDNFTTIDVFEQLRVGNPVAEEALNITVEHLGRAIASILNTVDVEEVVIGGGLAEAGSTLLDPLKKIVDRHVFPQIRGDYGIVKADLGNDAGVYGAVYSIKEKLTSK